MIWLRPEYWPWVLAASVVAAAVAVHAYRRRGRLGIALALLRVAAVAAVAAAWAGPAILERNPTPPRPPRVIVLVDPSPQMNVTDPGRSLSRAVAIADALGLIAAESRPRTRPDAPPALAEFAAAVDGLDHAAADADILRLAGRDESAARARVADAARRFESAAARAAAALAAAPRPDDDARLRNAASALARLAPPAPTLDRNARAKWTADARQHLAEARNAVDASQARADEAACAASPQVRDAADLVIRATRSALAERALARVQSLLPGIQVLPVPVDASLPRSLRSALTRGDADAVLVISDGGFADESSASTPPGTPPPQGPAAGTFALLPAAPDEVRDLAVIAVEAPDSLLAHAPALVTVRVRSIGFRGLAEVTLANASSEQSRTIQFDSPGERAVQFPLTARGPADAILTATINPKSPADAATADGSPLNNTLVAAVRVLDRRTRVTVIASVPTWDAAAFIRALRAEPTVQLRVHTLGAAAKLPDSAGDPFESADVIVLADVAPDQLSPAQWAFLQRALAPRQSATPPYRASAGLILLPGPAAIPRLHRDSPLTQFLPPGAVAAPWQVWPAMSAATATPRGGFYAASVPGRTPALDPDPARAARLFANLPPLIRVIPVAVPAGPASALATDRDTGLALITRRPTADAAVIWVGTTDLWRWARALPEAAERRLWTGLLDAAAPRAFAAVDGPWEFDVASSIAYEGQAPAVSVRRSPAAGPAPDIQIVIESPLTGGTVAIRQPANDPAADRIVIPLDSPQPLPPGRYILRLRADGATGNPSVPLIILDPKLRGLTDPRPDLAAVRKLLPQSASTSNRLFTLAQLPALADQLRQVQQLQASRQPTQAPRPLWPTWPVLLIITGLLGVEWSLRRRAGMP